MYINTLFNVYVSAISETYYPIEQAIAADVHVLMYIGTDATILSLIN